MSLHGFIESKVQYFRKKSGKILLGYLSAELIEINFDQCIFFSFNDITVQKDIENVLKESEKRLRSLVEFGMDAILLTAPDGRIFSANPASCEMFDYTEEEIIKLGRNSLVDLTDPRLQILLNDRLKNGKAKGELTMIRKGGIKFPVEISSTIFTNHSGEKRTSMIIRDLTDQKRNEEQLLKAKEKAEESDNLKTAFLNTILHEIRTPINAIVGFSEFLNNTKLTSKKRKQFVEIITKSSYQLLSIITNIVKVATIKAGQEKVNEKVTDINTVCELIYNQYLQVAQEKNLLLNYSIELLPIETLITTDETKLIQILSNLVENALKFTLTGYVNFGCMKKNNFIEFYVKDSGIGIFHEIQDEIFKPFRQGDYSDTRKFGGSGLGLTISKAYVEMLGGNIRFNSEKDKGTEFYFSIPYKHIEDKFESDIISIDDNKYMGPQKVILVVDDERYNFMLIDEILKGSNFSILHAENGIEAIDFCQKRKDIDLILMDIMMPVMGGYEAASKIREFNQTIPIIAQTAYIMDYDRDRAKDCGFTDFISKPFKTSHLLQIVKKNFVLLTTVTTIFHHFPPFSNLFYA